MGKYSAPVAALVSRIESHLLTGEMLEGWNFEAVPPTAAPEGREAMPVLRLFMPAVAEDRIGGLVSGDMTIRLAISTDKTLGLAEHVKAVELVLDAIETTEAGTTDASLGGALLRPFSARTEDQFALELSLNTAIVLNVKPKAARLGDRRS